VQRLRQEGVEQKGGGHGGRTVFYAGEEKSGGVCKKNGVETASLTGERGTGVGKDLYLSGRFQDSMTRRMPYNIFKKHIRVGCLRKLEEKTMIFKEDGGGMPTTIVRDAKPKKGAINGSREFLHEQNTLAWESCEENKLEVRRTRKKTPRQTAYGHSV